MRLPDKLVRNRMKQKLLAVGIVCGLLAFAPVADATPISVTDNASFVVNWWYTSTTPVLTATATFTISDWSAAGFALSITGIQNTTPIAPDINARLTAIGFGLTPDASVDRMLAGEVYQVSTGMNFPAFKTVDVCAYAGPNCGGGGSGGLQQGSLLTDSVSMRILGTNVVIDPLAAKFQTAVGSFEVAGCSDNSCSPVPEPASMLLFGTGLLGAGMFGRKRRK